MKPYKKKSGQFSTVGETSATAGVETKKTATLHTNGFTVKIDFIAPITTKVVCEKGVHRIVKKKLNRIKLADNHHSNSLL